MEQPKQYETQVGEHGVKLSGGQKQKLLIGRAILADPKVLILDKATLSVDTETEILSQQAIDNLVKDRATFVIAHRLSTIQHADLIVVLESGRVVETSKHEDLLALNGLYPGLHEVQFHTINASPRNFLQRNREGLNQRIQPKMPSFDDMRRDLF